MQESPRDVATNFGGRRPSALSCGGWSRSLHGCRLVPVGPTLWAAPLGPTEDAPGGSACRECRRRGGPGVIAPDAEPRSAARSGSVGLEPAPRSEQAVARGAGPDTQPAREVDGSRVGPDRKSTRLNSSHTVISYAVFCLKKKIKIT